MKVVVMTGYGSSLYVLSYTSHQVGPAPAFAAGAAATGPAGSWLAGQRELLLLLLLLLLVMACRCWPARSTLIAATYFGTPQTTSALQRTDPTVATVMATAAGACSVQSNLQCSCA